MNSIPMTGGGFLSERDSECVMEEYGEEEDTYTLGFPFRESQRVFLYSIIEYE